MLIGCQVMLKGNIQLNHRQIAARWSYVSGLIKFSLWLAQSDMKFDGNLMGQELLSALIQTFGTIAAVGIAAWFVLESDS